MEEELQLPPALADPKNKRVLVADDDESILDIIEHMAKKEGFQVERAADGSEAMRKVQACKPDLIVLDFMLPDMGGFELIKELQCGEARDTPILVITGRRVDQGTIGIIRNESNVCEFIEKPIKFAMFAGMLHRILRTKPPEINRVPDRGPLSGRW